MTSFQVNNMPGSLKILYEEILFSYQG